MATSPQVCIAVKLPFYRNSSVKVEVARCRQESSPVVAFFGSMLDFRQDHIAFEGEKIIVIVQYYFEVKVKPLGHIKSQG